MRLPGYNVKHACGYARTGPIWQVEDEAGRVFLAKLMDGEADLSERLAVPGCVVLEQCIPLAANRYVLLMHKVPGRPLAELGTIKRGQLREWLDQVEVALHGLHARGRSHGDVTLANILVSRSTATLIDITPDANHHAEPEKCAADFAALNALRNEYGIPVGIAREPETGAEQRIQWQKTRSVNETDDHLSAALTELTAAGVPATAVRGALLAAQMPETIESVAQKQDTKTVRRRATKRIRRGRVNTASVAANNRCNTRRALRARKTSRRRIWSVVGASGIIISLLGVGWWWNKTAAVNTSVQSESAPVQKLNAPPPVSEKAGRQQHLQAELQELLARRNQALSELNDTQLFDLLSPGSAQAQADRQVIAQMRKLGMVYRDLETTVNKVHVIDANQEKMRLRAELSQAAYRVCKLDSNTACKQYPAQPTHSVIIELTGEPAKITQVYADPATSEKRK